MAEGVGSSRLVNNASGWTDRRVGDIIDMHSYPGPECPQAESDRAAVLGEFGGLSLGLEGHTWSSKHWGYWPMPDVATLNDRYRSLMGRVHLLEDTLGLSGAIYTQTADVETECNGMMTYDRAVAKLDPELARRANSEQNRDTPVSVLFPNAIYSRTIWKYTVTNPPAGWMDVAFDDSGWQEGVGGFGVTNTPNALVNTVWDSSDIWLRKEFRLNDQRYPQRSVSDLSRRGRGGVSERIARSSTRRFCAVL